MAQTGKTRVNSFQDDTRVSAEDAPATSYMSMRYKTIICRPREKRGGLRKGEMQAAHDQQLTNARSADLHKHKKSGR